MTIENSFRPVKVLVVDDDVATLELMEMVFTSLGVEVQAVSESRRAWLLIQQSRYDGIFLDLQMPALDGVQLAREIRLSEVNRRTPIIIVSGRDESGTMRDAFSAGATFFLQKPVDRRKLTNLLNTTLGSMVNVQSKSGRT